MGALEWQVCWSSLFFRSREGAVLAGSFYWPGASVADLRSGFKGGDAGSCADPPKLLSRSEPGARTVQCVTERPLLCSSTVARSLRPLWLQAKQAAPQGDHNKSVTGRLGSAQSSCRAGFLQEAVFTLNSVHHHTCFVSLLGFRVGLHLDLWSSSVCSCSPGSLFLWVFSFFCTPAGSFVFKKKTLQPFAYVRESEDLHSDCHFCPQVTDVFALEHFN